MKIGVMTVNGFDFHPNRRFREEAGGMGHEIFLINPYAMACRIGKDGPQTFFSSGLPGGIRPDLVMPRQGSPMGEYGFVLLEQWTRMGIPLVNGIRGVGIARNQFLTLQALAGAGLPIPSSCFVLNHENFFAAVAELGGYPVVAKQVNGMGGDGVARIDSRKAAEDYLACLFDPVKGLLVQAYVAPQGRRDLRLMVVGDEVAGAMALTPAPGEFKANVHQAGTAAATDPGPELGRMAVAAARACGLEVAGVDMMVTAQGRTMIVEVNYSPGFRGLEGATGLNIAGRILAHAVNIAGQTRKKADQ